MQSRSTQHASWLCTRSFTLIIIIIIIIETWFIRSTTPFLLSCCPPPRPAPLGVSFHAVMEGETRNCANRSFSSLSLPRPEGSQATNKRRLLLIYIHGFMGSEASFHDLPAHVHDLLTGLLSESHVVYTRIYPRYKSHGELRTAVEQFSAWYMIPPPARPR